MGPCAKARAHGCGGTGARRGVRASPGSGTGGWKERRRLSSPTAAAQKLPACTRGTRRCWQLAPPAGREALLTQRPGWRMEAEPAHATEQSSDTPLGQGPPCERHEGPKSSRRQEPKERGARPMPQWGPASWAV